MSLTVEEVIGFMDGQVEVRSLLDHKNFRGGIRSISVRGQFLHLGSSWWREKARAPGQATEWERSFAVQHVFDLGTSPTVVDFASPALGEPAGCKICLRCPSTGLIIHLYALGHHKFDPQTGRRLIASPASPVPVAA